MLPCLGLQEAISEGLGMDFTEKTAHRKKAARQVIQCVAGLVGLIVLVVLGTWLAPGWWAKL